MVGYRQQVGEEAGWRWSGIVNRLACRLAGDGRVSSIGWRGGWLATVGYRQQVGVEAGWRWSGIVNRLAQRLAGDGRVSSTGRPIQ